MNRKNLTDVVFKLSIDLGTQLEGSPELQGIDVSPIQMRVLRFVRESRCATPLAIAAAIRRDKGHVTRLLKDLLDGDLVTLVPNPDDRRSKIVALTPKSKNIFDRVHAAEAPIYDRAVAGVGKRDLETFFAVAQKVSDNLSTG